MSVEKTRRLCRPQHNQVILFNTNKQIAQTVLVRVISNCNLQPRTNRRPDRRFVNQPAKCLPSRYHMLRKNLVNAACLV